MGLISLNLPNPAPAPAPAGKLAILPLGAPYSLGSLASLMVGVKSLSGQYVMPQTALRASAVLACVRILTEDLAALPLNLYRRTPQGAVLATDHPLFHLLHAAPNNWQTSMELRESMILDVLAFGQSFVEKEFGPDGISALYPLSAGRMVYMDPLDMFIPPPVPLFFRYADPRAGQRTVISDDLWITRLLAPGGTIEGQSIILLAREAIGLALAAEEQGARLFNHGIQTDFVLEGPDEVGIEEKEDIRKALLRTHGGSANAFMPMILTGGLTAKKLGLTAQESQYIEAREFQLQDIARIFRIPEVLIGISGKGKSSTYASAEQ